MSHFSFGLKKSSSDNKEVIENLSDYPPKDLDENVKSVINAFSSYKKILVYGYVQSGKTANMINVVRELFGSNKIDLVIVLTGTTNNLNDQNFNRFYDELGKYHNVLNFNDSTLLSEHLPQRSIIVTLKNPKKLNKIISYTKKYLSSKEIVLIIDDEADSASLDNNNNSNKTYSTVTHSKILDLLNSTNSKLLSYTATPQGMLLGGNDNKLKPDTIILLDPYSNYFGVADIVNNNNIFREIEDIDKEYHSNGELPDSLKEAIMYFNKTSNRLKENKKDSNYIMLINNTLLTRGHKNLKLEIETYLNQNSIKSLAVFEVNGRNKSDTNLNKSIFNEPGNKIIVGGTMLSRGLTIPNLLVFYSANISKENKHDTVYQRMRFCGYRDSTKEDIRVYSTKDMFDFYTEIHFNTELIRNAVRDGKNVIDNKIWYISNSDSNNNSLIPTKKGVMSSSTSINQYGGSNNILLDPFSSDEIKTKKSAKIKKFFVEKEKDKIELSGNIGYILYKVDKLSVKNLLNNIVFSEQFIQSNIDTFFEIYDHYSLSHNIDSDYIYVVSNFSPGKNKIYRTLKSDNNNIQYLGDSERFVITKVKNLEGSEPALLLFISDINLRTKTTSQDNLLLNFCFLGGIEVKCYELP